MTEQIVEMILSEIVQRTEDSGQAREYNYVFEITTADSETGEVIMDHEYRTLASDEYLSDLDAYDAMLEAEFDKYGVTS